MLLELGATLEEIGATLDELCGVLDGASELLTTATLDELSAVWLELEPPGPATQAVKVTDALSINAVRQWCKTACFTEESIMATLICLGYL